MIARQIRRTAIPRRISALKTIRIVGAAVFGCAALLFTNIHTRADAIVRVQHKSGSSYFGNSIALTLNSPTTSGNTLIVAVTDYYAAADPDSTIADNKGNIWKIATNYSNAARVKVYYAQNITGGFNHQVTISTPTGAFFIATAVEYSGLGNSGGVIDAVQTDRRSSSSYTSGSLTTTSTNELLFGVHHVYSPSATFTPGNSWLTVETKSDGAAHTHQVQDRVVSAMGSYASTGALSAALDTQSVVVAFKAAPGAGDTSPPTIPADLTAGAVSSSRIDLAWTASTDDSGVAGYQVERCAGAGCANFALVGNASGSAYSDTNLAGGTTYLYRVRAYDEQNNYSGYSSPTSSTTQLPDTQPPTLPGNLTATALSVSRIDLSWSASTDNVGVVGYRVERCQGIGCATFGQVATSATPAYSNVGLSPNTSYTYRALAYDAATNQSSYSGTASATTPPLPVVINSFTASPTAIVAGQASTLSWSTSNATSLTLDQGIGSVAPSGSVSVSPSATTTYVLTATNSSGSVTAPVTVTVSPDGVAPSTPGNLTATVTSASSLSLSWSASTDNVGVVGYRIERCAGAGCANFADVATATTLTYADAGLSAGTLYSYRLRAHDAAGNHSSAATLSLALVVDTEAPTAPTNVTATATGATAIEVAWTASTDDVGVVGYAVERCTGASCTDFVEVGTPTGSPWVDAGLTGATSYRYRVRAGDAAGNRSSYSAIAAATTAVAAPVISSFTATPTAVTAGQAATLAWTTSGGTTVAIAPGVGTVSATGSTSVSPAATTTYTLTASNSGGTVTATVTVTVSADVDRVQHKSGSSYFGNSIALTLNSPTTSGNTLIVAVTDYYAAADPDSTIADNKGNIWKIATNYSNAARVKVYYAQNITGGFNHQVTISTPTGAFFIATAVEYSGLGNSGGVIDAVQTDRRSSSSYTSGSLTTTSTNELLFGVHHVYSPSATFTPGNSWLTVETKSDGAVHAHQVQDRVVSAMGSYASTGALSAALDTQSVVVAFKAAPGAGDTSPPTIPADLTAGAVSSSRIDLAWTASTDDSGVAGYQVERCAGAGCANFALVGNASGSAYSDTNLAGGTTYLYRVRAYDEQNNYSGYSSPTSSTTQSDTQPPTLPGNLTATALSVSRIDLSWSASTDNVGVVGYRVERCQGIGCATFGQVATSATPAYSNVGLSPNTSYTYRVLAYDAATNQSSYSGTASATTPPLPVVINSFTASPTAIAVGQSSTLSWSTSNATSLTLDQGIGPVSGTTRSVSPTATTTYTLSASNGVDTVTAVVTLTVVNAPPTISSFTSTPATLTAGQAASLSWATSAATVVSIAPGVGNVTPSGSVSVSPSATTTYVLTATNSSGSVTAHVTVTVSPDGVAPSTPGNLTATVTSASSLSLSWSASTDNVGVVGYRIERCAGAGCANFADVATATTLTYADAGLSAGTLYSYRLRAHDAAGNHSSAAMLATSTPDNAAVVTRLQHKSGSAYYLTNLTLTLNSPTTSGNTLIVAVTDYYAAADPDSSIADNKGNSWNVAVNYSDAARVKVYYAQNITGGSNHQITISTSASAFFIATAVEYSGLDTSSSAVDVVRTNRTTMPIYSSGPATTTSPNALLFGVHHVYSPSATFTPDDPWVTIETRSDIYAHSHHVQERAVGAIGSYASSGSLAAAFDTQSVVVAFKVAVSAGDGTPPSTPSDLSAVVVSTNRIDLSWTPSTDNIGVAGYEVERCSGVGCSQFAMIRSAASASVLGREPHCGRGVFIPRQSLRWAE